MLSVYFRLLVYFLQEKNVIVSKNRRVLFETCVLIFGLVHHFSLVQELEMFGGLVQLHVYKGPALDIFPKYLSISKSERTVLN